MQNFFYPCVVEIPHAWGNCAGLKLRNNGCILHQLVAIFGILAIDDERIERESERAHEHHHGHNQLHSQQHVPNPRVSSGALLI